jgi:hypothetical protein
MYAIVRRRVLPIAFRAKGIACEAPFGRLFVADGRRGIGRHFWGGRRGYSGEADYGP